jgi:hypothetical protein
MRGTPQGRLVHAVVRPVLTGKGRHLKPLSLEWVRRTEVTCRAMKAYSLDLRQRVLSAALRGDRTIEEDYQRSGQH